MTAALCPVGFFCLDVNTVVTMGLICLAVFYFIYTPPSPRPSPKPIDRESPLSPPERTMPIPQPPLPVRPETIAINTPTRGERSQYQQIGVLIEENNTGNKKILPLYGQQTYRGSNNWRYYTDTDGFQSVKLPVLHKNKNCQEEYGCDEIYDGDNIRILAYENPYKASLYPLDSPRYLPV